MGGNKANKIRQIVRLQQIVKKWHKLASARRESLKFNGGNARHGAGNYNNNSNSQIALNRRRSALFSFSGANSSSCDRDPPPDVPEGCLAVYVGKELKRFIIPTVYLKYPVFKELLAKAEEEFGFDHRGGLTLPCDTVVFQYLTWKLAENDPTAMNMALQDFMMNFNDRHTCQIHQLNAMTVGTYV